VTAASGSLNTRPKCDTGSVQRPSLLLSPYWRGSLYYTLFWRLVAIFAPFINLHWQGIGVTSQQLGWLSAVGPLMALAVAPIISRLADLRGAHRESLAAALFGTGAAIFGLGFAQEFSGVLIGSVALGIAACAFGPLADGLIARMASRRQLEFGRMRLWGSVSFAVLSLAFGWLWSRLGYGHMLFLTGALMLLMTPFALLQRFPGSSPTTRCAVGVRFT
jgi:MFS transporter, PPP family, 3-phenylpropionic acid transporter